MIVCICGNDTFHVEIDGIDEIYNATIICSKCGAKTSSKWPKRKQKKARDAP